MLTDEQINILASKMNLDIEPIIFKSEINNIKPNKNYIINLEDQYDEDGNLNSGSHWVCLVTKKNKDGKTNALFFDSFGISPAENIKQQVKNDIGIKHLPYNTKNIQSIMANACGFYCLAYLFYVNNYEHRPRDLYQDTEDFLEHFLDLNESEDFKQNEYVLKLFFQPKDKALRKEIDVFANGLERITEESSC